MATSPAHKHILGRPQTLRLTPPPGFLDELQKELERTKAQLWSPQKFPFASSVDQGSLLIKGDFITLHEVALRLRTLQEVSLLVAQGRGENPSQLRKVLGACPLLDLPTPSQGLSLRVRSYRSHLWHEGLVRDTLKEAWAALRPDAPLVEVSADGDSLTLEARLVENHLQIWCPLLGRPPWKRGWRSNHTGAKAPLREDLASGVATRLSQALALQSFPPVGCVAVPFAGSGTLGFEEILRRLGAPGHLHETIWAREMGLISDATMAFWKRKWAQNAPQTPPPPLWFLDNHPEALAVLEANCTSFHSALLPFGLANTLVALTATTGDFFQACPPPPPTGQSVMWLLNPPWGLRLGRKDNLYKKVGERLRVTAASLQREAVGAILCPSEESWRDFLAGARPQWHQTSHFLQGGQDIRLTLFGGFPHGPTSLT